ncbi:Uncharacterised protein [Salmonella enterica]|nr:Uncharacterised protein [Salmonella enterica]
MQLIKFADTNLIRVQLIMTGIQHPVNQCGQLLVIGRLRVNFCCVQRRTQHFQGMSDFRHHGRRALLRLHAVRDIQTVVTQGQRQTCRAVKLLLRRALVKRTRDTVKFVSTLPLPAEVRQATVKLIADQLAGHQME